MRKREVLECFKTVFSDFLNSKGYTFYKNCFIKYNGGVLNKVGILTRKKYDTVSFDIIHNCKAIYENFESIEFNNEYEDFSLLKIASIEGVIKEDDFTYEYNNEDMILKLNKVLDVYKKYFNNFHSGNIEKYKINIKNYDKKLEESSEEFETLSEKLLVGDVKSGKNEETDQLVKKLRWDCYYIIEYLNETLPDISQDDVSYVKKQIDCFNEDFEYLQALCENNSTYIDMRKNREQKKKDLIIMENKELMKKAGFNIEI